MTQHWHALQELGPFITNYLIYKSAFNARKNSRDGNLKDWKLNTKVDEKLKLISLNTALSAFQMQQLIKYCLM